MQPALEVNELTKKYRISSKNAVDHISFSLAPGEILGFLGPNGSGKTTTIQMLLGLLTPTKGTISYFGKDFFSHRSESLHQVSFASTYSNLPSNLTIGENLLIYGTIYGMSRKEIEKESNPLLEQLGLVREKQNKATALSSGQMTRLMLVKALLTKPRVMLLDEPTASLDVEVSQELCQLLLRRREETGLSILFTSHKLQEVSELCDRVIFLKKGHIIANETPEILAKASGLFRVRLIAASQIDKLLSYLTNQRYIFRVDHHTVEISLEESAIPHLLSALTIMEITYASIQIKEPSLDDYFLQMAKL